MSQESPEAAEKMLIQDIRFLEQIKRQKLEMMKICEARIFDVEEEYLENTLHRHGNVYNAWKEIKQDKSRFGSITDKQ